MKNNSKFKKLRSINRKKRNSKLLKMFGVTLSVVLIAGSLLYYDRRKSQNVADDEQTPVSEETINLSSPTEDQKKETETRKKTIGADNNIVPSQRPTSNSSGLKKVTPMITSYGVYDGVVEVGSRIPNSFDTSGTCTLVLSKGDQQLTKSKQATPNPAASEMSCGYISIPISKLSDGTWTAVIKYKSDTSSGKSSPESVRVG